MSSEFIPILIFAAVAIALSAIAVIVPAWLGPRQPKAAKGAAIPPLLAPYESGKLPIGPARRRFSVQYYLYAALFILFDVGVVFLYPWAIVFKSLSSRWAGLAIAGVLVLFLVAGLVYVWKKGGLEWD